MGAGVDKGVAEGCKRGAVEVRKGVVEGGALSCATAARMAIVVAPAPVDSADGADGAGAIAGPPNAATARAAAALIATLSGAWGDDSGDICAGDRGLASCESVESEGADGRGAANRSIELLLGSRGVGARS